MYFQAKYNALGYNDLGYSGCAAYSDLNPRDEPLSLHK